MLHNEEGFTYPLTFCTMLMATILLSMHIDYHLTETRFLKESENLFKQEYYLLSSLKRVEKILLAEDENLYNGVLSYSEADVYYETAKLSDTVYKSTFKLQSEQTHEMIAYGYFDREKGRMIKWIERN